MRPHARPPAGPGPRPHARPRTAPARRAAGTPDWAGPAAAAPPPRTAPPSGPPPRGWRDGRAPGSGRTRGLPLARARRDPPPGPRAGTSARPRRSRGGGNRLLVAAVVAPQGGRRLMHGEGDGAAGAGAHVAAGGTLQVRREAAPIQEQDYLLAPPEGAAHGFVERHGPRYPAGVGYPLGTAQVDDLNRWQGSRADPVGQFEAHDLPRGREVQRFEGGRGAAQNLARPLEPRALERHVTGMVARRRPLLVARLVLLVHHDRPEPLDRSEHR